MPRSQGDAMKNGSIHRLWTLEVPRLPPILQGKRPILEPKRPDRAVLGAGPGARQTAARGPHLGAETWAIGAAAVLAGAADTYGGRRRALSRAKSMYKTGFGPVWWLGCRVDAPGTLLLVQTSAMSGWKSSLEKMGQKLLVIGGHERMRRLAVADVLAAELILAPLQLFATEGAPWRRVWMAVRLPAALRQPREARPGALRGGPEGRAAVELRRRGAAARPAAQGAQRLAGAVGGVAA